MAVVLSARNFGFFGYTIFHGFRRGRGLSGDKTGSAVGRRFGPTLKIDEVSVRWSGNGRFSNA